MSLFRGLYEGVFDPLKWKGQDINDYERIGRVIASIWRFLSRTALYVFCFFFILGSIVYAARVAMLLFRKF